MKRIEKKIWDFMILEMGEFIGIYTKKIIDGICIVFGFVFLVIGAIGVIIPMLPTTPFLLLAAVMFAKGSKNFHKWFLSTTLYQKHIVSIVEKKEMALKGKLSVLTTISIMFAIAFFFAPIWHVKALITVILLMHYYYFLFRIRTLKKIK